MIVEWRLEGGLEGVDLCTYSWLTFLQHKVSVVQKLAQHCKAIILQEKQERHKAVPSTTASKRKKYLEIKRKRFNWHRLTFESSSCKHLYLFLELSTCTYWRGSWVLAERKISALELHIPTFLVREMRAAASAPHSPCSRCSFCPCFGGSPSAIHTWERSWLWSSKLWPHAACFLKHILRKICFLIAYLLLGVFPLKAKTWRRCKLCV